MPGGLTSGTEQIAGAVGPGKLGEPALDREEGDAAIREGDIQRGVPGQDVGPGDRRDHDLPGELLIDGRDQSSGSAAIGVEVSPREPWPAVTYKSGKYCPVVLMICLALSRKPA